VLRERERERTTMKFYIQNIETGLVLDIKDQYGGPNGKIVMYRYHGENNQLWTYENGMIYSKLNKYVLRAALSKFAMS